MFDFFSNKTKKFPLVRVNKRVIPNDYKGYIYIWDLDGTYLNTDIKSIEALIKVPFELAHEKENIPASDILLKSLRKGIDDLKNQNNPIYFITASPPQLKSVIDKKLKYDGVQYDGIVFKDYIGILSNFMFKDIFNQFTYKLFALIDNRARLPKESKEILFGDNLEQDSEIYSMYEKLLNKNTDYESLKKILYRYNISEPYLSKIIEKAKKLSKNNSNPIKQIYIHLTEKQQKFNKRNYSKKLIPISNFFQASVSLFENGCISLSSVREVFLKIQNYKNFTKNLLLDSLNILKNEGYIMNENTINKVKKYLKV